MAVPGDLFIVCNGIGENGDRENLVTFFVSQRFLEEIEANGQEWRFSCWDLCSEAVTSPDVIFRGLSRAGVEKALCYSIRSESTDRFAPQATLVFLVYVRTDMFGHVIFDWTWRKEDPDAPGHPTNWQRDFKEITWQNP